MGGGGLAEKIQSYSPTELFGGTEHIHNLNIFEQQLVVNLLFLSTQVVR